MQSASLPATTLSLGSFVRVRADHADSTRAGRDATVVAVSNSGVGLIFGTDRYGHDQNTSSSGIEAWDVAELDLATAEY